MKTFIQFLEEQKSSHKLHPFETSFGHDEKAEKKYPPLETSFGHDKKAEKKYTPLETSFGHDEKAKHKNEDVLEEQVSKTPGKMTAAEQTQEHGYDTVETHKIHADNKVSDNSHVRSYTGAGAYDLNRGLHHHYRQSIGIHNSHTSNNIDKLLEHDKKTIKSIDEHLNKHTIKKDIHVFTGLPHSPVHAFRQQNAKKGESIKVHLPAYTSTTTDYHTAVGFANQDKTDVKHHSPINTDAPKIINKEAKHILKLHLPKGTKGGSVRHISSHADEDEILLHRGHNIEIHPHPTVDKNGAHVWHARIISHTPSKID